MTRDEIVPAGLRTYGVLQLAQGLWMAASPSSFYDKVGPFGPQNDHYIRDAATWSIALGVVCLVVAAWDAAAAHAAVLLFAAVQAGLHTLNHLADIGDADPAWVGVFDAVSLAALTGGLALLTRMALAAPADRAVVR